MQYQPPAWAQCLLRSLLEPRHRDTIPGDLIEDYRERLLHHEKRVAVNAWYLRQVLSFVTARSLLLLLLHGSSAPLPVWVAAVAALQFAVLVAAPAWAGVTLGWALFSLGAIALAAAALCSLATAPDRRLIVRVSGLWILPFTLVSVVTLTASTFSPIPGVVIFFFCVPGAAWHASVRSGRLGLGITAGGAVGSMIALLGAAGATMLHYPYPPLTTLPFVSGVAAMLGAVGGLFGARFSRFSWTVPESLSIVS
jgi:hypothetical protein